ncbi:MAG: SNF1-interacting protein [Bathelium mastoideum]|nr:MAG: SNF1-interacting protein [Bathelium mastoideum]
MAEEQPAQQQSASLTPVGKPLNLIPVGLKEAAWDSPTFRATALFFSDQIEVIERWLDGYVRSVSRLAHEANTIETAVNALLSSSAPPPHISEAVLDHDYTLIALKKYGEGAKEFWNSVLRGMKKSESVVVEPIRAFLNHDLKHFREVRRLLDQTQRTFDSLLARYMGRKKTEEASSLREDAFQLHEARKAYLRASMDFCVAAPQARATLDRLLVKIFAEQWRDMKGAGETIINSFGKQAPEMERVRGWSKEMENSERVFKRELQQARQQIEQTAESSVRPSRELEDYAASTVPFLGGTSPALGANTPATAKPRQERSEKQSWLMLKTVTGKPTRTVWVRRWFFVKNGIFGWLVQGLRSGGVEESEKTGVLLCSVRPAFQEERRFCFEVKTKDTTVVLQAETQTELTEWIQAFEVAKRKALEDPASTDTPGPDSGVDPAFAISPPIAPEFAAKASEGHVVQGSDEFAGPERISTGLGPPGLSEPLASRSSFDVSAIQRPRDPDREKESSRDHAARIIQKLDLHRKSTATPLLTGTPITGGGIASLISASHTVLPLGPQGPQPLTLDTKASFGGNMPTSTLAPSTLANPPAPTNLSTMAVVISGERGVGLGRTDKTGGMPSGIMANMWGSTNWGYINRLERGEVKQAQEKQDKPGKPSLAPPATPVIRAPQTPGPNVAAPDGAGENNKSRDPSPGSIVHRKTLSVGDELTTGPKSAPLMSGPLKDDFPNYYPLPLKAQDAQFRILFPNVPRAERLVLVFRATWNPNDQQEFPGRVYVTVNEVYFYSHHLGLVLISGVSLASISEVTAAPGRDCDFLYLHFKEARQSDFTRITIKTFLEPLKLLQRRLNFLVRNCSADQPAFIEDVLKTLIKMETEDPGQSPSVGSWEDLQSPNVDGERDDRQSNRRDLDVRGTIRIDGNLYGETPKAVVAKDVTKFKLPSQPVLYAPQGFPPPAVEKIFDVSAKALFHTIFGDRSAVFQMLYKDRWASRIIQTPWSQSDSSHFHRSFTYETSNRLPSSIVDYQLIDVLNDHLCYVVTDKKTPWHLPHSSAFLLHTKLVITHVAKARCKLALFTRTDWTSSSAALPAQWQRRLVSAQARTELALDAADLADLVAGQVAQLGARSRTAKAVQIFGHIGLSKEPQTGKEHPQQPEAAVVDAASMPGLAQPRRLRVRRRTIAELAFAAARKVALRCAGWLLAALAALARSVLSVCSAHAVLLACLALSVAANMWAGQREAGLWWRERNAVAFMRRVGVTPEVEMARAVWLRDVEEWAGNASVLAAVGGDDGNGGEDEAGRWCADTFGHVLAHADPAATSLADPSGGSRSSTTSRRLQRTRSALGGYRHDLLVALRVVNRIEKEVVEAEWEAWVRDEVGKCAQLEVVLREKRNATSAHSREGQGDVEKKIQVLLEEEGNKREGGIEKWYQEYCGSCRLEWQGIRERAGKAGTALL